MQVFTLIFMMKNNFFYLEKNSVITTIFAVTDLLCLQDHRLIHKSKKLVFSKLQTKRYRKQELPMYKDPEKYIFHRFFVQSRLRKLYFLLHTVHDKLLLVIENKFLSYFHDLCMNLWSSRRSKS